MAMSIVLPLLRIQLDQGIDTHDADAGLDGTLELSNLAHAWLQHTDLNLINDLALGEIQTVVLVALLSCNGLLVLAAISLLDAL
ncbi:hypothetical protein HG530_009991 [Fusarium avenaceum]|nr:hypothetical protein HG530_009991 [Fusarium avenaceum]